VPAAKGAIAMDKKEKSKKRGTVNEFHARAGEYGGTGETATDSWFKQRLNHVRNEAKKELRTRVIRIGREK
jgi:hypothetical protein